MKKDIAGLDIPVHDVWFDENLERLQQVFKIVDSLLLFESTVEFDFLFESASVTVLIDEVVVVGCLEDFDEADDVGGVFDLREGLYLVDGELFKFRTGFKFLYFDDFDGHGLVVCLVGVSVDFAELSFAHDIVKNVVLNLFAHDNCLYKK